MNYNPKYAWRRIRAYALGFFGTNTIDSVDKNYFSLGRIYINRMTAGGIEGEQFEKYLGNAVVNWAAPNSREKTSEGQGVDGELQDLDEAQRTLGLKDVPLALVHVFWHVHKIKSGALQEQRQLIYDFLKDDRKDKLIRALGGAATRERDSFKIMYSAIEATSECFSVLENTVKGIEATPKAAQAVLAARSRYYKWALPGERPLLNAFQSIIGAFSDLLVDFQKEQKKQMPNSFSREGAEELLEKIEVFRKECEEDESHPLRENVLSPALARVDCMVREVLQNYDKLVEPSLSIADEVFKLDIQGMVANQPVALWARIQNTKQDRGVARAIRTIRSVDGNRALLESDGGFCLECGAEALAEMTLNLNDVRMRQQVPVAVSLSCEDEGGRSLVFESEITIRQQSDLPGVEGISHGDPPYAADPIGDESRLYGRTAILDDLETRVCDHHESIWLWGQKRVGKTSVVKVLRERIGVQTQQFVCAYLGKTTVLMAGQEDNVALTIAMELADAARVLGSDCGDLRAKIDRIRSTGGFRLRELVAFIRSEFVDQRIKVLIIVDEFDSLSFTSYESGGWFMSVFKSLADLPGVVVVATGSELMFSIYMDNQADLNAWHCERLDIIESEGCHAFVVEPVKGLIEFNDSAVERIVRYCGGNPNYLRLFCARVLDVLKKSPSRRTFVGESDVERVKQVLRDGMPTGMFAHFWEDDPKERQQTRRARNCFIFLLFARRNGDDSSYEELMAVQEDLVREGSIETSQRLGETAVRSVVDGLVDRKIVEIVNGRWTVILPIFANWLREESARDLLALWRHYGRNYASLAITRDDFPMPVGDLLDRSPDGLKYLGRSIDERAVRDWLEQFSKLPGFNGETAIVMAFFVLNRLLKAGFKDQSSMEDYTQDMELMIRSRLETKLRTSVDTLKKLYRNVVIAHVDSEVKSGASVARELARRMCVSQGGGEPIQALGWKRALRHYHRAKEKPLVAVVDDFAGTGDTMARALTGAGFNPHEKNYLKEALREKDVVCFLLTALRGAVDRLDLGVSGVTVRASHLFPDGVNAFPSGTVASGDDDDFRDSSEVQLAKNIFGFVGGHLSSAHPLGYGNSGTVVAFYNGIPNTTLPALWKDGTVCGERWQPLFPRATTRS